MKLSSFPGKNTKSKPTKQHENIISQINSILSKVDLGGKKKKKKLLRFVLCLPLVLIMLESI